MAQRRGAYPHYPAQDAVSYTYAPSPYAKQQQQQPLQAPYSANTVQYPAPTQQGQGPYFSSIPTTAPLPPPPPQSRHTQRSSSTRHNVVAPPPLPPPPPPRSLVPDTSDNGHSAPLPEPNSPSGSQYENEDVEEALRRRDELLNDAAEEDDEESGEPVFHLPPPPETTYPTNGELEESMHAWSLEHGYELVRRASKKNSKGILYKRYYHCSKHGKLANTGRLTEETRVRINRKSNRINCPMSLAVVAVDPTNPAGEWQIRHRKTHHNHGPLDALGLAGHRRRARMGGVEKAVDGLFAIGTPTAQVLQFLQRTNPNGLFTRTDVANMKLKYKKHGTCIDRRDTSQLEHRPGFPSACLPCRSKKVKCGSQRPMCENCRQSQVQCQYDHDPSDSRPPVRHDHVGMSDSGHEAAEALPEQNHLSPPPPPPPPPPPQTVHQQQSQQQQPQQPQQPQQLPSATDTHPQPSTARAEEILAELHSFQTTHVRPTKLSLQSSTVEVLAASSCGNGDSYGIVPTLRSTDQWQAYHDAMTEASMKENTFEVLVGTKTEPVKPADDCRVEDWNEHIKQLAIYNRRNMALLSALMGSLSPTFRLRTQHAAKASEIWQILEDMCLPRGSDQAFRSYLELHAISHQNSADLKDYVIRLETAYNALNRVAHMSRQTEAPMLASSRRQTVFSWSAVAPALPSLRSGWCADVFTEEMLCFLFLKNLRPEFGRWTENMCMTNNIAGFGTGPRVGFADLTRRAIEWEVMQSRMEGSAT